MMENKPICSVTNTVCTYCQAGACGSRVDPNEVTNFDNIKNMTVDEMASFLDALIHSCRYGECHKCPVLKITGGCRESQIKTWLMSGR